MSMSVSDRLVGEKTYITKHDRVTYGFRKLLVEFKSEDISRMHAVEVA